MNRRIAGTVCGRRMKWAVVAFWIVVTVVLGFGFGSKITDEENNEASSWLPGNAESTEALAQTAAFQSENTLRTTVVYERSGGLTDADLAKVNADLEEFSGYDGQTIDQIVGKAIPDGDTKVIFDGEVSWTDRLR